MSAAEFQVGVRYMYDGMLVEVTVIDEGRIEFRAIHDQEAIARGWFPTSYDTYEASMSVADFRSMVNVPATQEELLRLPAGSLIEDRHGVTWQLLASSGTFAGLWSCDGAALPAPIGDIWDDIAPVVLTRVGDAPAGGAA